MTVQSLAVRFVLNPGTARGTVLTLSEPLSFWGGFDPANGRIIDRSHPQAGETIAGRVLALPGTRGSAGTPGGVADALRRRVGPAAIVLIEPDVNLTTGAQVADHLYGTQTPVVTLAEQDFRRLRSGMMVVVTEAELAVSNRIP